MVGSFPAENGCTSRRFQDRGLILRQRRSEPGRMEHACPGPVVPKSWQPASSPARQWQGAREVRRIPALRHSKARRTAASGGKLHSPVTEPSGKFLEGICAKAVRPFLHARGESRVAKGRLSRARIPLSGLIGLAASRSRGWLVLDQLLRHGLRTTQRAHPGLRRAR
jgi:hypothetical protein